EDGFFFVKNSKGEGYISDLNTLEKYNVLINTFQLKGTAFWRVGF
ncbi:hypothetical protein LEP1GSC079_2705, partial [Leptospira interrogans str. FPW1039]